MINIEVIKSHQQKNIFLPEPDFLFPDYSGFGLANLPASICQWLHVPGIGMGPLYLDFSFARNEYDQVILIVVDGLGWKRLERWIQEEPELFPVWKELFGLGQISPLTSVVPSTTCAALTTLSTGVPPAVHGNLAYELWIKEFGVVANMITHTPMAGGEPGSLRKCGFRPEEFLPVKTLDAHLISHGVSVSALHPTGIARSSLTGMLFPQAKLHGYHSMGDLWFRLQQILFSPRQLPAYDFIYWSEIDELSHIYGPEDIRVKLAFRDFSLYLHELVKSKKRKSSHRSILAITSDHGFMATPFNADFDLNHHPEFMEYLAILPTGENRLPFLNIRPGKEKQINKYIETSWPEKFKTISSQQLIDSGLFGTGIVNPKTPDRLGDLVVIPKDDAYWWWSQKTNKLKGRHGGLSIDEMLVPIAMIEM